LEPDAAPSTTSFWFRLASRIRRSASSMQNAVERVLGKNVLWAAVFVALLTPILSQQECGLATPAYKVGEVATGNIKAPYDIEVLDEAATRDRRETERAEVAPVYDLVVGLPSEQRSKISGLFEKGREAVRRSPPASRGRAAARADAETIARLTAAVGQALPEEPLLLLIKWGFSQELEDSCVRTYSAIMQGRVVAQKEGLPSGGSIVVREVRPGVMEESALSRLDQIRDLDEARAALRVRLDAELREWTGAERKALASLLERYVSANLSYNASETERRRTAAMASVPEVFMRVQRGRVIVREGEVFTPEALEVLSRIRRAGLMTIHWKTLGGNAVLLSLLVLFMHRYVQAHQRVFRRVKNLYTLVLMVALFIIVGAWAGLFIANSVADQFFIAPFNDPSSYYWALPVSAGAMLITLLANGRVATVAAAMIAALFGVALGWDPRAMLFALLSSFAAIYGISRYQQRTAILKAGAVVGLVNVAVVFSLKCIENGFSPVAEGLFEIAAAALGGLLVVPVVAFSLPMLEWLFNVLTDIRLLELSILDNALLRRLALEVPGTYNHSVIVGTLAEQAASEIGAHALFCRVAAYYHDIGKMSKPEYFVENMRDGMNRHDRLSPRMSSLIIASHVKEGIRLSVEYNLPRQIRDIIPQHHGTRLITFFYRKAKRKADPEVREIHESDYRYPGPKPQSKEAAIFMMADSVEAAARSVDEPTQAKFEEVIRAVSNAIVLDGQLDECDLTFSDLARINASFLKTLNAVHHHRISYPGFEFDRSKPRAVEAE
jgi:hypothetical protein